MLNTPSVIRGWDKERDLYRTAHEGGGIEKLVTEFSNACDLHCPGCFTVKVAEDGSVDAALAKKRLPGEMTADVRIALLREAVDLGVKTVDIVGAGEPMLDRNLRGFVEEAERLGVHVVIFTHGAHREFSDVDRLSWWVERPVSFFIKMWSNDASTNDLMLRPKGRLQGGRYTDLRNQAIENLLQAGFGDVEDFFFDGRMQRRTRLGADILVTKANLAEVPDLFRFCRINNIQPIVKNFIPEGPTKLAHESGVFGQLDPVEQALLQGQRVSTLEMAGLRKQLNLIDLREFGNPALREFYAGGMFCTQSMGALYVPISGGIYSCVGTGTGYGKFRPGDGTLKKALEERVDQVGFGCFPRLEDARRSGDFVPSEELRILSQV